MGGNNPVVSRRAFLTGDASRSKGTLRPPGVTAQSLKNCTGCGACAEACPTKIIAIRSGLPTVDFANGECTFCGICADRCPERVFPPGPSASFSHHAVVADSCLAINFVDCQACRDSCPTQAFRFKPRLGGPFVPSLDAGACTGCGACVAVCPTRSISMSSSEEAAAHA